MASSTVPHRSAQNLARSAMRGPKSVGGSDRFRLAIVTLAFIAMVTGGLKLAIGTFTLTMDRALGLALVPLLVIHLLGTLGPRGPRRLLWWWTAWLAVLGLSMLLTDDPVAHLVPFLSALIPVGVFSLMTIGTLSGRFINALARALLWVQAVAGTAILAIRYTTGGNELTAPFTDELQRLKLLTFEPNLLATTLGFLLLISLPRARWSMATMVLYASSGVVLVGTLSKMPLIALVIALVLYAVLRSVVLQRNSTAAVGVAFWIGGVLLTALIGILPLVQDVYVKLLDRADTVASRLYLYRLAVQRFWDSPLIGRGPGDFGLQDLSILKVIGAYDRQNLWIGQMLLSILHDSGIAGLIVYLMFLVMLFGRAAKWVRAGSLDHAGYVAGFAIVLISSQATTAHLLALFGVAAGLVASTPFTVAPSAYRLPAKQHHG